MINEPQVNILLVEDDPDDVWIMQGLLGDRWDGPYHLTHAEMLEVALRHLANRKFDVVLLDLSLPDSQGLETFARLYREAPEIPIVVLTGNADETLGTHAVQTGAEDYLVKGQVDDAILIRSVRYAVERGRRRRAEANLRSASEEIRAAQQVQKLLFPEAAPRLPGFDIAAAMFPAREAAGDYYDFFPLADGRLAVAIGDVSGHGMGPALLMAETRASLRALADNYAEPSELLTLTNRVLTSSSSETRFVTLILAALSVEQRRIVYSSAGQRGYLLTPVGEWTPLESTGLPLGIKPDAHFPQVTLPTMSPGAVIAFFTDGLYEMESPDGQRFGTDRALQLISENRDRSALHLVELLHESADKFRLPHPRVDDITIVIIKATE
jgi:serine phosphatase RsbU (regulator of sigma subunit)